jgi:hypothetical protein
LSARARVDVRVAAAEACPSICVTTFTLAPAWTARAYGEVVVAVVGGVVIAARVLGALFALGRAFDYPNILREEPDAILRRFAAGGSGLLLRWQALLVSAVAMMPLAVLLAVVLAAPPALTVLSIVTGTAAALVQTLGLVRWPFAVPERRAA